MEVMCMEDKEIIKKLNGVFREVFDNESIVINEATTAESIEEWDSLGHILLILAVEKAFNIRFKTAEIAETKKSGQNVGSFVRMLQSKCEEHKE
jgi:acyl carrier protein